MPKAELKACRHKLRVVIANEEDLDDSLHGAQIEWCTNCGAFRWKWECPGRDSWHRPLIAKGGRR